MLKYKYIFFQIKCAEAILSNITRKLLWFEICKMLIAVIKNKFIVLFIMMFGTLSFPIIRRGRAHVPPKVPFLRTSEVP